MKKLKAKTTKSLQFLFDHYHLVVGLVLFLALLLRLPLLSGSFWLDEAAQFLESIRPLSQQLEIAHDFQPPLMHLLVHLALYFGQSEAWLRFVGALIPGLVTIWMLMLVVKEVSCHFKHHQSSACLATSLLAGLLLATNTWHIFYSQELRPYSLPAMFGALSWYVLIKNLAPSQAKSVSKSFKHQAKISDQVKTNGKNNSRGWLSLVSLGLLSTLGLYSSYLYPFLILSQLVYLVYLWWQNSSWRRPVLINASALMGGSLLFLPWLPKLFEQLQVSAQLRQSLPTWQEVVSIPQAKGLFLVFAKFVYGLLRVDLTFFWVMLSLAVVTLAFILLVNLFKSQKKAQLVPFLIWFLVPVVGAWLISFFIPVLRPKRVLLALPALEAIWAMLIVHGWWPNSKSSSNKIKLVSILFFGFLLMINIYSYLAYLTKPNLQREPWRQAINQVTASYPDKAIAVFAYPNPFSPWRVYAPNNYPTLATGKLSLSQVKDLVATLKSVKDYRYVITFDYLSDLTDPKRQLQQQLESFGFSQIQATAYPNLGVVRVYFLNRDSGLSPE